MASLSFSLGGAPKSGQKPSPPPPKNGVKRLHAQLDDESDDEDASAGKRQNITHFDSNKGGAVDVTKPKVVKAPLIIKAQANRDWKEASQRNRRQKYGIPDKDQEANLDANAILADKPVTWGLNVKDHEATQDTAVPDATPEQTPTQTEAPSEPKTDEQRAIDALTGVQQESTLTIPAQSEEEAFEQGYKQAPRAPTLEDYAAVPVEEFGAAMLRGMGWKEGQGVGTQKGQKVNKSKMPERRPALLGIGAKPDAAVADELGAWGRTARGKKKVDITYNPLVLRNAKTGEQLTEVELQAKLRDQKEKEANQIYVSEYKHDEKSSHRHRDDDRASSEKERRRLKSGRDEDGEGRESRRHEGHRSRRDRSPSYDRERVRRREKERGDEYEDRRRRDRDHDRGSNRKDRYDDDRKSSRKDRRDDDRGGSRRDRDRYDDDRGHSRRDRYNDDRDRDSTRHRR